MTSQCSYMCGKCCQIFISLETFESHNCSAKVIDNIQIQLAESGSSKALVYTPSSLLNSKVLTYEVLEEAKAGIEESTSEMIELEPCYIANTNNETNSYQMINNSDQMAYMIEEDGTEMETERFECSDTQNDVAKSDEECFEKQKKRKKITSKYNNKLVRDPYFKFNHNSYTFKETLGDWNEESTKLLIELVGNFPKSHFILQFYYERRLNHWERIQSCMLNSGYKFTVLQIRMRWREVISKYRRTLNTNDVNDQNNTCEYMDELQTLFGHWSRKATEFLLNQVLSYHEEHPSKRVKRISYSTWEKITMAINANGYQYSTQQVEARWRMLVTTMKSVIDHNAMPNVEMKAAAFAEQLQQLIKYEPRRRKDYEKYKGQKIKQERFPAKAMKFLTSLYKLFAPKFLDPNIKNFYVWEDIQSSMQDSGYNYSTKKLKEILFANIKLYEKAQEHNSIPGAIKREGLYYKELHDLFSMFGFWPHVIRRRKSSDQKHERKFYARMLRNMQSWHKDEISTLLHLYPEVLHDFIASSSASPSSASHQTDDFWVQLAHAYHSCGCEKRHVADIACQVALLKQGYEQARNFPFSANVARVIEAEVSLQYQPDTSKYTAGFEMLYWSEDAVHLLLDAYMQMQPLMPYSYYKDRLFMEIMAIMNKKGFWYTKDEICAQFDLLISNLCPKRKNTHQSGDTIKNKQKTLFDDKLAQVTKLREDLFVDVGAGMKPLSEPMLHVLQEVGHQCFEVFYGTKNKHLSSHEQRLYMKESIIQIRKEMRKVNPKLPSAKIICIHLLNTLTGYEEAQKGIEYVRLMYEHIRHYDYRSIISDIINDVVNGTFKLPKKFKTKVKQEKRAAGFGRNTSHCTIDAMENRLEEEEAANQEFDVVEENHHRRTDIICIGDENRTECDANADDDISCIKHYISDDTHTDAMLVINHSDDENEAIIGTNTSLPIQDNNLAFISIECSDVKSDLPCINAKAEPNFELSHRDNENNANTNSRQIIKVENIDEEESVTDSEIELITSDIDDTDYELDNEDYIKSIEENVSYILTEERQVVQILQRQFKEERNHIDKIISDLS